MFPFIHPTYESYNTVSGTLNLYAVNEEWFCHFIFLLEATINVLLLPLHFPVVGLLSSTLHERVDFDPLRMHILNPRGIWHVYTMWELYMKTNFLLPGLVLPRPIISWYFISIRELTRSYYGNVMRKYSTNGKSTCFFSELADNHVGCSTAQFPEPSGALKFIGFVWIDQTGGPHAQSANNKFLGLLLQFT